MILVAVYTAFFRSQQAARDISRVVEKRQNARLAIQLLERDIRMAGSGWGRIAVGAAYNSAPCSLRAVTTGYGGSVAANDTIGILGGWDFNSTITTALTTATGTLKLANVSGFKTGDFCVVVNGQSADLFYVTGVNTGTLTLAHANTSPYNTSGGHTSWPPGGYPVGSQAYRMSWVSYKIDSLTYRRSALVRAEAGKTPQVIAYDITGFKVYYDLQDGTVSRSPNTYTTYQMINRIRPTISIVANLTGQSSQVDSARASLLPRAF